MATTPRGFRDILPDEAEMREHIVATVKTRLVHHGYRPIETPLIESASVGGANAWSSDAPFNLFDDNGALLAVRPDNTTSVVHAIAARMSERDLPLRLRYEAPVVRQQPRGTAQARQFTQLGYELVGEGGDAADAEMTLIAAEALDDLGLNSWQLVCGSVVPYQALLELGVDEALANEALALVHANNYIDLDELAVTSDLPVALQCAMRELPRITGGPEALDRVDALLRAAGSTTSTTTELRSLVQRLTSCNAELASHLSFDFSLMSSFGYYTGLVLKAYAGDLADPVGSGAVTTRCSTPPLSRVRQPLASRSPSSASPRCWRRRPSRHRAVTSAWANRQVPCAPAPLPPRIPAHQRRSASKRPCASPCPRVR